MKIVLISGMSGSGKTSICKNLCQRFPDKYHFVNSFTDREKREKNEWGHEFLTSIEMDKILQRDDIVAQTKIEENRYCTILRQFEKDKINLYIVDINGINDTISTFSDACIMTILVRRNEIESNCVRLNRDVAIPIRDDVDFLIDNNGTIDSSANLLNAFVNFDFFSKPSKRVQTLKEKIDYIDMQCRFLKEMKESIYEQIWYQYLPMYKAMCKYVEQKINDDFDFEIKIKPDASPEIFDGTLTYNIQAEYNDGELVWSEINRLVEQLSFYAYDFCEKNKCKDIIYHLAVSERWIGEDG